MADNNNNNAPSLSELLLKQEEQAGKVRAFKKSGASTEEIERELKVLLEIKAQVAKAKETSTEATPKDIREPLNKMLIERFFYCPSFEMYGGVAGLYDFGPAGAAMKKNLIDHWRNWFVISEGILELEASIVTPMKVLETSGHVAKFADWMVKDTKNGNCYRADHLIEQTMDALIKKEKDPALIREMEDVKDQCETYEAEQLNAVITKYKIKAPDTKNDLSGAEKFNLMFPTQIGPTGKELAFLRPETAQGMFINFKRLLDYNHGKLPFGAAQIGAAYRNEIKPQQGLMRVREFTLAEIEYFVDPQAKTHPRWNSVKDVVITLFPAAEQTSTRKTLHISVGDAVDKGIIANQALAYFIARTALWLLEIGIDSKRLRFRQHLRGEMAHYACDCWDAEIHCSYGWVECVGLADRSCYDLNAHAEATHTTNLGVFIAYEKPVEVTRLVMQPQKQLIGKQFRQDAKIIQNYLDGVAMKQECIQELKDSLDKNQKAEISAEGKKFVLDATMIKITSETKKETGYMLVPSVIEPAFGIGRIMYALMEHAFYVRENDEQRSVLSLKPAIAPVKVAILPLLSQEAMNDFVPKIGAMLSSEYISFKSDESGVAVGRRYARMDQLGTPFALTIDHTTLQDNTITLRERDSRRQVRVPFQELLDTLLKLIRGRMGWEEVWEKYPHEAAKEEEK